MRLTLAAMVDAIRANDIDELRARLEAEPALAHAAGDHDKTLLHWAAEMDRVEAASLLVDVGADPEAVTSWGATPFDWAAVMGSAGVADLLLARGATGLSLISAAALGRLSYVRDLVGRGGDLSSHRRRGAPAAATHEWPADTAHIRGDVLSDALHAAARNGHTAVVAYLASHGGNIDATAFFGATGLHWAASNGHRDTVVWMIEHGASLDRRDARFSATAEDWAREGGHEEVAELLVRARRPDKM